VSALRYDIDTHLDDPVTTLRHRDIILNKPPLKKLYEEWYGDLIRRASGAPAGKWLEVGSGGGFLKQLKPDVITSDIMPLEGCDMTLSAEELPFGSESLAAIVMLNVFHHIPRPWRFLEEAVRTLVPGGKVVMIEPANSTMSRFIYQRFHHEPFDPKGGWEIVSHGPLSSSNQALPYIYFQRDKAEFAKRFPALEITDVHYHTPFRYVLTGGVSRKALMPAATFGAWKLLERGLQPLSALFGMFMTVELTKRSS
jgi:SAM-dependent methyltransferase